MRSTVDKRSRRTVAGLGVALAVAGGLMAGVPAGAQSPNTTSGEMRFMMGPWSPQEKDVFAAIAANCQSQFPNVTFSVDLFDWGTSAAQVTASLADNAHDIYYLGEGIYPQRAATEDFLDLTDRINDPAFAEEKAKYVNWERTDALSPRHIGLPIAFHVEDALFVNMDKLRAAGFDETLVDSWDTFKNAVAKMTTEDTYGLGVEDPDRRLRRVVPAPPGRRWQLPDGRPVSAQRQQARSGAGDPGHDRHVHERVRPTLGHLHL